MQLRKLSLRDLTESEDKIDKLSDAMVSPCRAEEKLIKHEKNNHAGVERMNRFSQADLIEQKVDRNAHTVGLINRLFWIVIVAAAGQRCNKFLDVRRNY